MKLECSLVTDLLPNYIENLTTEVTNQYIQKHINMCPTCRRDFEDMSAKIEVEIPNQDKEINYLKGIKRYIQKLRIYGITITFLLILFITVPIICRILVKWNI